MLFKRKESVPVSIRMDKETYKKLTDFCNEAGQSKTLAIERAVEMYVQAYYDKQAKIK